MTRLRLLALVFFALTAAPAAAQEPGTLTPKPLPPLANPDDPKTPAKELFGRKTEPAPLTARSIGGYARGGVAGATALPIDGETGRGMRPAPKPNPGAPALIVFLEGPAPRGPPKQRAA